MEKEYKIAVVGQGYVGLPLALAFAQHYPVVGFDINAKRIEALQQAQDETKEADADQLKVSRAIVPFFSSTSVSTKAALFSYFPSICSPIQTYADKSGKSANEIKDTKLNFNTFNVREFIHSSGVVFDTKSVLKPNEVDSRL